MSSKGRFTHSTPFPCRAYAVPLPCRATKGLECVFPIWFTRYGRVWFTLAMPCPCHAPTMPFFSRPRHSTAVERRGMGTACYVWIGLKEASNNSGLCLVKGQQSGLSSWTMDRILLWSLSLSTDKNPLHYHMLVIYPAFNLFPYILPRNPQGRLWSNKVVNSSVCCELVGNFISSRPRMSRDTKQPHSLLGGNVIQRILAMLYKWGRLFSGLKGFQSRLTVRTNTNIFLWNRIRLNFMSTGHDSLDFGLEDCSVFS